MNLLASKRPFQPQSPDAAGVISSVHLGDLHMTKAGEQNHLDLAEIVNEVNQAFADSVSFIFLPGDVADDGVVSWRFVELGKLPVAVILSPSDERLLTESSETAYGMLKVRAKFWGEAEAVEATAYLDGQTLPMKRIANSQVWEVDVPSPQEGVHPLEVCLRDADGDVATDEIRLAIGQQTERQSEERDQDNALEAWPEHGLLGTQLGPNKNGKKW